MSNIARMMQRATAGAAGAGLDVDEVFSTYLYDGNNTGQSIVNGIDLSGEGGLVWTKVRDYGVDHALVDTVRGNTKFLQSNSADEEETTSVGITAFNNNGYTLGADNTWKFNASNSYVSEYVSWTFRKAPKFFDVVKYNGTGSTQNISHNLGVVPAMIMVKGFDSQSGASRWNVYHKDASPNGTPQNGRMALNTPDPWGEHPTVSVFQGLWNNTAPTDSVFTVGSYGDTNGSGQEFIAYLFANNNNDGEFGPSADQDIIKCGSYTGNTSTRPSINLGFEPQFLMIKRTDSADNWYMLDTMRGIVTSAGNDTYLYANTSGAEATVSEVLKVTATGFELEDDFGGWNASGGNYIYMAIRRGPLAAPEDATKVFSVNETGTGDSPANSWPIGFETDMNIHTQTTGNSRFVMTRLLGGKYLKTNDTGVENTASGQKFWDSETGQWDLHTNWWTTTSNIISWSWKRAPSYFDAVAYSGTNSATTISHNLGAVPEMIWVKSRANANRWTVFHKDQGPTKRAFLELTQAFDTGTVWNNTAPTSTVFSVGTDSNTNSSGHTFIAYLFATVAGVSKVGSVTHSSGSTTNVDCGFSSGARFVLVKSTAVGYWRVWDSVRGIVAGNDPYIHLNDTSAEVTNGDLIDPYSGGFALAPSFYTDTYIFYAIA